MKLANLRIGTRLWLGFGLVISLLILIVAIAMARMHGAEKRIDNILEDRYKKIALMTQVKYNMALIHQHMRMAVVEGDADGVKRELDAITALRTRNRELLDIFDKIINVPRAREIFNEIVKARSEDLAMQKELFALISAGNQAEAKNFLKAKVKETERIYIGKMTEMVDLQTKKMEEEAGLCKEEFAEAKKTMVGIALTALLMALSAAWYATRSITRPMNEAVEMAKRVASGDLTARIDVRSTDETG